MHACFNVETSPTARKSESFTRFWRKLSVLSLLLEIFRSLSAIFISFLTPNAMHACFIVETGRTARKMQPFTRFWRKLSAPLLLLEILRSLSAVFERLYASNTMHAGFIDETSPTARKMQPFTRFWRKLNALSLLLKIFRSLSAVFERFYASNTMHAGFIDETSPTARKMQPLTRFWRKLSALTLQMAIFRRLNAIFIKFYMPNVVHVVFSVETSTTASKS